MDLDLIALTTMLIIMSLFGIGLFVCLIIMWYGGQKTDYERYYEDLEQMEYLKNKYKNK